MTTPIAETLDHHGSRSSGDVIADRRYDYAVDCMHDGDFAAAAEMLEQTLEIAPRWAAAWFVLAEARDALADRPGAISAYGQSSTFDQTDVLGAQLRLARLGATATPTTSPPAHVAALFDQYAARFEIHLVESLGYRGPEILREAFRNVCNLRGRVFTFECALDLGCGTGLVAKAMKDHVARFVGVDLSRAMIVETKRTGLYDRLAMAEIGTFLRDEPDETCDIVIAADVFVYVGDVADVFEHAHRVLRPKGLFGFSLQANENVDYILGDDLRFAHSHAYVGRLAARIGFEIATIVSAPVRRDNGVDIPGSYVVLAKP